MLANETKPTLLLMENVQCMNTTEILSYIYMYSGKFNPNRNSLTWKTSFHLSHRKVSSGLRETPNMDHYLHQDSHLHIGAKYNIINTVNHKAKTVTSLPELLRTEKEHSREVFSKCKYPHWHSIGWN